MDWSYRITCTFLKNFRQTFALYGDMSALMFLRQCVPVRYHHKVEGHWTLEGALTALAQWCSDAKIHTEKIEQELRAIPDSTTLEQDRATITKQISQIQKCMEIDEGFFMNLATVAMHASKYFEPTLYKTALDNLNTVARKNRDGMAEKIM